jgi:hypothetical protein
LHNKSILAGIRRFILSAAEGSRPMSSAKTICFWQQSVFGCFWLAFAK